MMNDDLKKGTGKKNLKNVKPVELKESVEKVFREGGKMSQTIFEMLKQEGFEIGEQRGIEIGDENRSRKVALKCILKGMDNQMIFEITELPLEEIELLREKVLVPHEIFVER